jgi:hypothetical protein
MPKVFFIEGKWADYVKSLLAEPQDTVYNKRVNFYRMFSGLCQRHPKEYRMSWFAGWIMYEKMVGKEKGVERWVSVESPADDMYDEIRYIAMRNVVDKEFGVVGE